MIKMTSRYNKERPGETKLVLLGISNTGIKIILIIKLA